MMVRKKGKQPQKILSEYIGLAMAIVALISEAGYDLVGLHKKHLAQPTAFQKRLQTPSLLDPSSKPVVVRRPRKYVVVHLAY